jgi:hypothetical protein
MDDQSANREGGGLRLHMADHRITRDTVLSAIYARKNRRRVIWSPSTTLTVMEIERYPHLPQDNYRKMKSVLRGLCREGLLVQRPNLHSNFTMKELAYERAGEKKFHYLRLPVPNFGRKVRSAEGTNPSGGQWVE